HTSRSRWAKGCRAPWRSSPLLELPQQPSKSVDAFIDAGKAQRLPDDGLQGAHDRDAELALQRLDRIDHRPVRRGETGRVGVGMCAHRLAPEIEGDAALEARDVPEWRVRCDSAKHRAAGIFTEVEFAKLRIGPRDHKLLGAQRLQRPVLGCRAAGDLDAEI